MDFIVSSDGVLSAELTVEKGKVYFLPNNIFPSVITRGDVEHMITKTDGGWYLTVLENKLNAFLQVRVDATAKLYFNLLFDPTKGSSRLFVQATVKNTLPSRATLQGFLLCDHDPQPEQSSLKDCESESQSHKTSLGEKVKLSFTVDAGSRLSFCLIRKELKPIHVVCIDFTSVLLEKEMLAMADYELCVSTCFVKQLAKNYRSVASYIAVRAKPLGQFPCSVKLNKEEYGEFGCRKINFLLTFGVEPSFCNKEVTILIKHPATKKCFTSADHLRGEGDLFYSRYKTTFTDNKELQQFSGYLIEL